MRRLAAARAMCEAFAARVMLRVSAMRTNRASEVRLGRIPAFSNMDPGTDHLFLPTEQVVCP
jgi:hypothetical protein